MNNSTRGVVYLLIIQSGFILTQFLSSFGGFFNYVGLYFIMPLLITELHYRYLVSIRHTQLSVTSSALKIAGLWVLGGMVISTMLFYLLPVVFVNSVLFPEGMAMLILKQMMLIAVAAFASSMMFREVLKVLQPKGARSIAN
jgi:hypothetical protein